MFSIRHKRLLNDYEEIKRLVHLHPAVQIEGVSGNPPEKYRFLLRISSYQSINDELSLRNEHRLEVTLPLGYPRDAPFCRMLTPVFHPNIAPHAVCIGDHWSAAESLANMVQRVLEMLAFQSYNVKSPLNGAAAKWVEQNPGLFPLTREELFLDLESEAVLNRPAGSACANCGAETRGHCEKGHLICDDCSLVCPACGHLQCVMCGEPPCSHCSSKSATMPKCANCQADATTTCQAGHPACPDCLIPCNRCGHTMCLACGEPPCKACSPSATS